MSLLLNNLTEQSYVPDPDYKAGTTLHDFSSRGQMRRIKSRTTGRVVYLMSKLEYMLFILLDTDPNVIDIREQYPHDLGLSLQTAFDLGINHPPQKDAEKKPLTTDFVVTLKGLEHQPFGLYVKYLNDLDNWRTIEKLQLERASLERQSIPLFIVTEEELCQKTHLTLEWILGASLDNCDEEELLSHVSTIERAFSTHPNKLIQRSLVDLDKEFAEEPGTFLYRFQQLVQLGVFYLEFDRDFNKQCGENISTVCEVVNV